MRRRILYLLSSSPMKAHSGHLRHREFLNGLSTRHDVRVVVYSSSSSERSPDWTLDVGPWIDNLTEVAVSARNNLTGLDVRKARAHLASLIESWEPHVIVADKDMGASLPLGCDVPTIIDFCDAKSTHHARRLRFERSPTALARLVRSFLLEQTAARRATVAMFVSDRDRSDIRFLRPPPRSEVVSNGLDVEYWAPLAVDRSGGAQLDQGPSLILTGRMNYPPNADAAVQLCRTVLPRVADRIPGVRAVVAGADPTPQVRSLAVEADNVEVTGTVPDLRPYLASASVFVAPMRFGAGLQNKVLEALAMNLPVVTTHLVAAGLRTEGNHAASAPVCAHTVGEMADVVVSILTGNDHRPTCGSGRDWVISNFSWSAAVDRLEELVEDLDR